LTDFGIFTVLTGFGTVLTGFGIFTVLTGFGFFTGFGLVFLIVFLIVFVGFLFGFGVFLTVNLATFNLTMLDRRLI